MPKTFKETCAACSNNDEPSVDAHSCKFCKKAVHLLPGCSIPVGFEQGHGELRGCITCTPDGK